MDLALIIGILGATIILVAFILNELHKLSTDSIWYDLANFIGAVCLVIHAYIINSWPFLILNLVWAVVSLRDVAIDLTRRPK